MLVTRVSRVISDMLGDHEEEAKRRAIFDELVKATVAEDCDTLDECRGIDPMLDAAIDEHWGEEDVEEEEGEELVSYDYSNLERSVSAANFCGTLEANVDNDKLTDAEFRDFVRTSLPIVEYTRPTARRENNEE